MASDIVQDLVLKFKGEMDKKGIKGIEKYEYILEQIETRTENIDKLKQSNAKWAKEELKSLAKERDAYSKILQLKNKIYKESKFKSQFVSGFDSLYFDKLKNARELGVGGLLGKGLSSVLDSAISALKNTLSESWKELKNVIQDSFLTSSSTRENVLGYGLSLGQSYGLGKTMSAMGISSVEDLLWMTSEQQKIFSETMQHYTDKYNQLYDSGFFTKQLEYQVKFQQFRDDVQLKFMEFFISNEDTIYAALNAILKIANKVLGGIGEIFGSNTSDAANIVSNYNNGKTVNINSSYNISGSVSKSEILSAGEQTMQQLLIAIKNS